MKTDNREYIMARIWDDKEFQTGHVQREEIVRCRDCKHWHSNTEFCDVWSHANIAQRTLADDYCSRGKRRKDDETNDRR